MLTLYSIEVFGISESIKIYDNFLLFDSPFDLPRNFIKMHYKIIGYISTTVYLLKFLEICNLGLTYNYLNQLKPKKPKQ